MLHQLPCVHPAVLLQPGLPVPNIWTKIFEIVRYFLHHRLCIQGSRACFTDSRVCTQLFCYNPASRGCVAYRPAAEGSACGPDSWCLNAKCVAKLTTRPSSSQLVVQPFYDTLSERAGNVQVHTDEFMIECMDLILWKTRTWWNKNGFKPPKQV